MLVKQVVKKLASRDTFKRDLLQIDPEQAIKWWESRRFFFNIVVGCTGIVTCVAMIAYALVAEPRVGEAIGLPDPPIFVLLGVIAFSIMANICYTGG